MPPAPITCCTSSTRWWGSCPSLRLLDRMYEGCAVAFLHVGIAAALGIRHDLEMANIPTISVVASATSRRAPGGVSGVRRVVAILTFAIAAAALAACGGSSNEGSSGGSRVLRTALTA